MDSSLIASFFLVFALFSNAIHILVFANLPFHIAVFNDIFFSSITSGFSDIPQ